MGPWPGAAAVGEPLSSDTIRLLTEIGFAAAGRGLMAEAETIFSGLALLRPEAAFPYIGLAITRLNAGQPDEAVRVLERDGLSRCPGNIEIRVFLGLALRLARRGSESDKILLAVLAEAADHDAARLARALLGSP
ncbi:tetratricopeptide repeat protein [Chitinimonas lacunae]|uniref:Tetratricopeptide repeat protein n=1 Tax=Chitinimonas lacunae TaxID=1963018 RepID=A0ABV8MPG5_9NEIS